MISKFNFSIIGLICLFYLFNVAAAESYQAIYNKCQDGRAACIVLSFIKGDLKATQEPITPGDQLECANDGTANQICVYKDQGGAYVHCNGSDPVIISNNGNRLTATYPGIIAQKVSTSGEGTSIFVVTCLVRA